MKVKKILVSQPKPSSEKSPYYNLESDYGVSVDFRPFIKVEGLSGKEFRQQKIALGDYTAVIFTALTAIDHYFRLAKELRFEVPETMKYFCISEVVARYLQTYIVYRKRKIFFSENGKADGLIPLIEKHKTEKYLYPVADVHDSKLNLEAHNLTNTKAVMYRTVSNPFPKDAPFDYDIVALFTPSGVKSLLGSFPDFDQEKNGVLLACMGTKTIEEVKNSGLRLDITTSPECPSMAAAIAKYLEEQKDDEQSTYGSHPQLGRRQQTADKENENHRE